MLRPFDKEILEIFKKDKEKLTAHDVTVKYLHWQTMTAGEYIKFVNAYRKIRYSIHKLHREDLLQQLPPEDSKINPSVKKIPYIIKQIK